MTLTYAGPDQLQLKLIRAVRAVDRRRLLAGAAKRCPGHGGLQSLEGTEGLTGLAQLNARRSQSRTAG